MASKGRLLAEHKEDQGKPTAGFRMDVPDYLGRDFKTLTDYGFRMRCVHGEEIRRYVKYDDDCYSLYLELRLPGSQNYLRITPNMVRSFSKEGEMEEIIKVRKALTARPSSPKISGQGQGQGQLTMSRSNFVPLGNKRQTSNNDIIPALLTLSSGG